VVVNKPSGLNTIPGNELVKEEAEAPPPSAAEAGATEAAAAAAAAASDTPAPPNHDTDGDQAAHAAATTTPTGNGNDTNTTRKKRTHQEMWHDMLRGPELQAEAAALPPDRSHLRPYLESIGARSREAVPRKRQRFLPWGQRTLKCDAQTVEELFEVLQARFEAKEGGRTDSVLTRLLRHFKEVKTVHRLGACACACCVVLWFWHLCMPTILYDVMWNMAIHRRLIPSMDPHTP
jgi:hypothetical protein